jgi:hypothetical protein
MPFLSAVAPGARAPTRRLLRVSFIGAKRQPLCDEFIAHEGIADVVRFYPFKPHAESVQYVADSTVLMPARCRARIGRDQDQARCASTSTRKPILALTIPATASILQRVA